MQQGSSARQNELRLRQERLPEEPADVPTRVKRPEAARPRQQELLVVHDPRRSRSWGARGPAGLHGSAAAESVPSATHTFGQHAAAAQAAEPGLSQQGFVWHQVK